MTSPRAEVGQVGETVLRLGWGGRQFLRHLCRSMGLVRHPAGEGRMRASSVIIVDSVTNAAAGFACGLKGAEEDTFVFEAAP